MSKGQIATVIIGIIIAANAASHSQQGVGGAGTSLACFDSTRLKSEMTSLDSLVNSVNAAAKAGNWLEVSSQLRRAAGTLDEMASTVQADPTLAARVQAASADEQQAAGALDAGKHIAAFGDVVAFNADWKAVLSAAQQSTLPAC